ncbi:hypothetical protein PV394_33860 [Streptomyces sp. NE06-03E]|uniref:Uncharacterized protein n=1 Tax=Streptomyces silvae TaxID=2803812 RepID=A0ABU8A614_9ACTN|nr:MULTISPECIES: hypothetical protein [unclassified Streptomyces]WSS70750.1 hypothetical protein OG491_21860 [Streptomyces sp. NBC_01175]MDX3060068.1 hypothetical protein [Streptomyces sp. NE06-03E]MDX3323194.1 hypothetical protein [Streptomyces sp. ME02-6979-3A]MDX3431512.1 hypothetical protein [Streptomyces sp. ME01-18a]MDX3682491.1 hypothetical protein [Streptomyces sp. AK04-4c]
MLRHEFRPGRAVAGLVMLTLAAGYAADAAGAWHVPWTFFAPVFLGGLWLAATVTWVSYRVRRRRGARTASAEASAPGSTRVP